MGQMSKKVSVLSCCSGLILLVGSLAVVFCLFLPVSVGAVLAQSGELDDSEAQRHLELGTVRIIW